MLICVLLPTTTPLLLQTTFAATVLLQQLQDLLLFAAWLALEKSRDTPLTTCCQLPMRSSPPSR